MSKKLLFIIVLVIILVSLNWFRSVLAQDLSSLSPEEKQLLLKKYKDKIPKTEPSDVYQSPQIFDKNDSGSESKLPDSLTGAQKNAAARDQSTTPDKLADQKNNAGEMPSFDELKPFGMELFNSDNENDIGIDIPSASDYVLGPGDNIIIYLWGRADKEYNLTLDREGKVFVPQVGEMVGWGLTLSQFTEKAKHQFASTYSDFSLTVSLGKIRSIRIFVAGEVKRPGAYTVSSLTSMFNVLYSAGGPTERGSMRQIRLMRNGEEKAHMDLYDLLLKGDNSSDIRLQTGDVIFVPVSGPRVAVRGEIKRPAIYELKGKETTLDLLGLAGNAKPEAHLERVMLERVSRKDEWKVLDLNLDTLSQAHVDNIPLVDGDRMTVYSIFEAKKNIVAIFGQVKHPGYYERTDSASVEDLLRKAQLQPYDVYYNRMDIFRKYPDRHVEIIPVNLTDAMDCEPTANVKLQDRDSLYVYSIDEVEWRKHVYIEGEIQKPGEYPLYKNMTVEDLIFLSGSYTRSALRHRAEIARLDSSGNVSLINVVMDNPTDRTTKLHEDDHLYVRQIPEWREDRAVNLDGEVQYPGKYTLSNRNETLYQLLKRAGGFTPNAFPEGVVLDRRAIHQSLERIRVEDIIDRTTPTREDSLGNLVKNDVVDYNASSVNRIIIDMDKILASNGREGDITLQPDDRIYVPTMPSGISVIGAVGANGTIKYAPGKNVKYYVNRAGDFIRQADKKQTRLIRATGEVSSGGGILKKRVELGDVIVVPTKIEKDRNFLKTMTTALSAATGLLTSVYIVSKL
ncbi:MAG TPA: SLBB domain-containing protein [candidate division Zixibacteria bacterium]|nr:SLBB domain-containing protein [candidate division Zixibacteria bacterium]